MANHRLKLRKLILSKFVRQLVEKYSGQGYKDSRPGNYARARSQRGRLREGDLNVAGSPSKLRHGDKCKGVQIETALTIRRRAAAARQARIQSVGIEMKKKSRKSQDPQEWVGLVTQRIARDGACGVGVGENTTTFEEQRMTTATTTDAAPQRPLRMASRQCQLEFYRVLKP